MTVKMAPMKTVHKFQLIKFRLVNATQMMMNAWQGIAHLEMLNAKSQENNLNLKTTSISLKKKRKSRKKKK